MSRHDDGDPQFAVHAEKGMEKRFLGHGIQLRRRLVKKEDARPEGKRGSQRDDLLLAAGQLGYRTAKPWFDAEEMGDLGDAAAHDVLLAADVLQAESKFVPNAVAYDLIVRILRNVTDERRRGKRVELPDRDAEKAQIALGAPMRCDSGLEAFEQRGLAAARRAHEKLKRTGGNLPIKRSQNQGTPWIGERETVRLKRRRRCVRPR